MDIQPKVGVISCSGEEIPAGTVSRLAVRRVLEALRPDTTVTLCLPLFLAGGVEEREFARRHPTITVDGCDKLCAKRGTEMHSGVVAASLNVTELLGAVGTSGHRSTRQQDPDDQAAVWQVAERIAAEVDRILESGPSRTSTPGSESGAGCACSRPVPALTLEIGGKSVPVTGLALIFDHCRKQGMSADESSADQLLATVKIYYPVPEDQEALYRRALVSAYRAYGRKQ